jgi:phosphonoacetaldehyde hydrolase
MMRVRAVVLDWAGTTVDHGSRAPVVALTAAFASRGIALSEGEARGPMGMAKRDHIAALLALPRIAAEWGAAVGRAPTGADADELYAAFQDLQLVAIAAHADIIPGVPDAIDRLRAGGIAIGSTTGYFRRAAEAAAAAAAAEGFAPDVLVCVDDVPAGRPEPWMLLRAMEVLRVFPPAAVAKVGDTAVDMAEGRNAGAWAVGVTETGNELGLGAEALRALPRAEREARAAAAGERLLEAGAHLVIASVAQLPGAIATIDRRLAAGERP